MKIAVYTIAKNEEQFVKRWADSCAEADYRIILDTGSTDFTPQWAMSHPNRIWVHQKRFEPWRFDHARNHALSLVPLDADLCIALDMDEVLQPGWRKALETTAATRPRYKYVWSWKPDGSEGLVYGGDKVHARHGYVWKHPVHEVLTPTDTEIQEWVDGLEIHHHPDSTKSRGQYLPLLELAVQEDPANDRNQFYLAREYYFNGQPNKAAYHFFKHLELSSWGAERSATLRYLSKIEHWKAEDHLVRACAEAPGRREPWLDLAKHYHNNAMWQSCRNACFNALAVEEKPLDYLCEDWAWGELAYDLMALSCYKLGLRKEAERYGSLALGINPNDQRLQTNMEFYRL
jgi:tetratricopeptide (TPR) repeat protein